MKIAGGDIVPTTKQTFRELREDDLQGRAAEVAYNVLFSIVPLLIFLTALSGFVARAAGVTNSMQRITTWLFDHMGTSQAQAVRDPIQHVVQSSNGGLLSVGALLALWGGKNAVAAIMKALNTAFDVPETRSWPKRTGIAIGLTVALGLAVTSTSAVFLAGSGIAANLTDKIGLGETWRSIWSIARWPAIAAILVLAVSFLYWAAPNIEAPFRWLTPGSILTVVVWAVATIGLGFYFANFAGYAGGAYGALGGVLAFIFWLHLMVLILLIGAELNSVLLHRVDASANATAPVTPPQTVTVPVQSVPRGTFATSPSPARAGGFRRTLSALLVALILAATKALLKLRPYVNRVTAATRH